MSFFSSHRVLLGDIVEVFFFSFLFLFFFKKFSHQVLLGDAVYVFVHFLFLFPLSLTSGDVV
jgi:hypothetical protein